MENKTLRIVELFSGIGSQAKAFKNLNVPFNTLHTCEWDIRAMVAYDLIHNKSGIHPKAKGLTKYQLIEKLKKYNLSGNCKTPLNEKVLQSFTIDALRLIYSAILKTNNLVNIKNLKGSMLPQGIDVMTYSFPCQDLSNVGHFHGQSKGIDRNANTLSGLLWEVERVLLEREKEKLDMPKVLVLENVTTLLSDRHKKNFEEWIQQLERLGYYNKTYSLKSQDFGSAQRRHRLIMISIFIGDNSKREDTIREYFETHNLENKEYRATIDIKKQLVKDCLRLDYSNTQYFEEAKLSQPNDTPSRLRIWNDNLKIVDLEYNKEKIVSTYVATITTKQDRHPNSGNIYFDYRGNTKSKFRYLTPRECFMLMGFTEKDYENIIKQNVLGRGKTDFFTKDNLLHLAGNSIVVEILEQVFSQIIDILKLREKTGL